MNAHGPKKGAAGLDTLDQMRALTVDRDLGPDDDYATLATELWDLQQVILSNPGALESMLTPVRRKEHKQQRAQSTLTNTNGTIPNADLTANSV